MSWCAPKSSRTRPRQEPGAVVRIEVETHNCPKEREVMPPSGQSATVIVRVAPGADVPTTSVTVPTRLTSNDICAIGVGLIVMVILE